MYVVELTYPGTWLDYPDRDWCWKIENQLHSFESSLIDAALALALFDAERAKPRSRGVAPENWEREHQRRREIEQRVRAQLGIDEYSMERYDEVRELVEINYKREQWTAGRLPNSYERRLIFLYARSFMYALDRLERCVAMLVEEAGVPGEVRGFYEEFRAAVPQLRNVRNSVAHFEERSQGLQHGRPIELQPVVNRMVHAPNGGVLILESLNNNRFGGTMADGHYGEIEVSVQTLRVAAECVQKILNAFKWKGWRHHAPI